MVAFGNSWVKKYSHSGLSYFWSNSIHIEPRIQRKDLTESISSLTAKDRLYGEALKLSINNDREKSSTLIKLADTLGRDDDGHIDKALQFILALAGSNNRSDRDIYSGHY